LARIAQGSLVATRPELAEKGLALKVLDDPSIDTSAHRKNILALTAEIESDIRRERQMDGIVKAQDGDVRSGRKPGLVSSLSRFGSSRCGACPISSRQGECVPCLGYVCESDLRQVHSIERIASILPSTSHISSEDAQLHRRCSRVKHEQLRDR